MATGQIWTTPSLGGYMYSDELSDVLRTAVQPLVRWRQFCDADDATDKNLKRGDQYHWDVYSDVGVQGGTLVETSTMPESSFTVAQGALTVTERGLSVPYTGKLDALSKHPVMKVVQQVLKNDCRKAMDIAAYQQFDRTLLRVVPVNGTATDSVTLTVNGTAASTNTAALGKGHVKDIVDKMKERNIPGYAGDDYFGVAHPTTWRQLMNDLESVRQYVDAGYSLIMNGEKGRYEGVRLVEQTAIPKGNTADYVTYTPWSQSRSNQAFFFGADTVMEAIAIPEEVRGKIPTDFGRSRGVAWYALNGFGIVHTLALQSRIVKWDSLA